jgi:exportin-T
VPIPTNDQTPTSPPTSPTAIPPSPLFPGFDTFAITRFSPLSWAIPSTPGFRIADPGSRALVHDIAGLQQEILRKTGMAYIQALAMELGGMGVGEADIQLYLEKLRGPEKGFRLFLVGFLGRG